MDQPKDNMNIAQATSTLNTPANVLQSLIENCLTKLRTELNNIQTLVNLLAFEANKQFNETTTPQTYQRPTFETCNSNPFTSLSDIKKPVALIKKQPKKAIKKREVPYKGKLLMAHSQPVTSRQTAAMDNYLAQNMPQSQLRQTSIDEFFQR